MRRMRVLFSIAVVAFAAAQLWADAPHLYFVANGGSGVGCTFAAPCGSWSTAIGLANSGDTITAITAGDFGEIELSSGKGVIIDGGGFEAGILGEGIYINMADGDSAVLRGLHLNGSGAGVNGIGIRFAGGGSLVVEDCEIQNYSKRGISIENITNGAKVLISNTSVSGQAGKDGSGGNGIIVIPPGGKTNTVLLDHVRIENNLNSGVGVNAGGIVEIRDSVISNNAIWGLVADGLGAQVSIEDTSVSGNNIGIQASTGGTVRMSNINVWNNATGLLVNSGTITSFGNNSLHGNTTANGPSPTLLPAGLQ
jgi:hypothetical protein